MNGFALALAWEGCFQIFDQNHMWRYFDERSADRWNYWLIVQGPADPHRLLHRLVTAA